MDRREFLKTAAFTSAGVALAGLAETTLLAQPSYADITSGSGDTWGASVQPIGGQSVEDALLALEGMAGRKFDTVHQRMGWASHLVNKYSNFLADRGEVPILSWFCRGRGAPQWAAIAAGQQDDRITAEATALKAAGWPAYFCFHKEPEDEPWLGNAAQWVAAHERVWQIFQSVGVSNATFVATYMAPTFGGAHGGLAAWAPPHYDLLGADGYNRNLFGVWKPFEKIFTAAHEACTAMGRKFFVIENGCVEGAPGAKAQWFADAAAVAKSWPELIGVSYNHEIGHRGIENGKNYRVDTSQSSIDGFRSVGATPFYNPAMIFYSSTGQTTTPAPGGGTGTGGSPPPPGPVHKHHHKRHHTKQHHKHHKHHGPRIHRKLTARLSRGSSLGS
jgi:hypothetical protein